MKKMRWIFGIFVLVLLLVTPITAFAQDYYFNVAKEAVDVTINPDGTMSLDYTFVFNNSAGGHIIDYVDVGVPNSSYDISSVTATANGNPLSDITVSEYVTPGIAIGLGSHSIQPGKSGTVTVHIGVIRDILYKGKDQEKEDYASFQFSPTWFGSQYVNGTTELTVAFIYPPGMTTEEPRWYTPSGGFPGAEQPEAFIDEQDRVIYIWTTNQATGSTQYIFGGGFPARLVPSESINKAPSFTISDKTWDNICAGSFCCGFLAFFGVIIYSSTIGAKKRKLKYMPPKISIEGNGVKRGLTAVEAGILMEQPMDKIMTMVLFSVLKKGACSVLSKEPLRLEFTDPAPTDLYPYEESFLTAMREEEKTPRKKLLQAMMVELVKTVSEKMKGFSRKETIAYYESIMEKAWQQVIAAATPEIKGQAYEEVMDWTMLDKKYSDRTRDIFGTGPVFVPTWWWRYDSHIPRTGSFQSPVSAPSAGQSTGSRTVSLPTLPGADFAASVVNSVSTFSAGVVGNVTDFTSGITDKTNPVPKTTYSSGGGRSSGGRSCACACACAGCACACAGGGR